jgi:hypothetical protein
MSKINNFLLFSYFLNLTISYNLCHQISNDFAHIFVTYLTQTNEKGKKNIYTISNIRRNEYLASVIDYNLYYTLILYKFKVSIYKSIKKFDLHFLLSNYES